MGLLDKLSDRSLDLILERHRARADFRADLVQQLRSYSQHIEQTRIAFRRLQDTMRLGAAGSLPLPPRALAERSVRDNESADTLFREADRRLSELGLDSPQLRNARSVMEARLQRLLTLGPPTSVESLETYTATVARRTEELDDAWAPLRVLLDEAEEFEAVTILRRFRHDLRYLVTAAEEAAKRLARSPNRTDEDSDFVVSVIDHLLLATDLWNERILGLRDEYR